MVIDYYIQEGFGINVEKANSKRFTTCCVVETCNWRIHAFIIVDKINWEIKSLIGRARGMRDIRVESYVDLYIATQIHQ